LRAPLNGGVSAKIGVVDYIFHLAAASHVDRSIENPLEFVENNVVGTCNILDYARKHGCDKFLYFSTDEVFGPAPEGIRYSEWDRYRSGNPYAASKAGAEELCLAYENTYDMPIVVTHTMNVFGERQHPEKFIPSTIAKVLDGDTVLIHSSPEGVPGSRFYIHARNVAHAALEVIRQGEVGDKYNIVGEKEVDNMEMAEFIADCLDKPLYCELVDYHSSRPGHDLRYALDGHKMNMLGVKYPVSFEDSLEKTIRWTYDHKDDWLWHRSKTSLQHQEAIATS
jgi:dTDP-glucose 4,6-dehydratase